MSFIMKNPLIASEISNNPPSPPDGTRGLFPREDGWYEIDSTGEVKKISNNGESSDTKVSVIKVVSDDVKIHPELLKEYTQTGTYLVICYNDACEHNYIFSVCYDHTFGEVFQYLQDFDGNVWTRVYGMTEDMSSMMWTDWNIAYKLVHPTLYDKLENLPTNKELNERLEDEQSYMKDYVAEELATFDFIKVVDELPEEGLANRIYFVPKTDSQNQDLFDEYVWINDQWEWLTTKQIEIDLTGYVQKSAFTYDAENETLTIDM